MLQMLTYVIKRLSLDSKIHDELGQSEFRNNTVPLMTVPPLTAEVCLLIICEIIC